jgi:transcriptional regulator with XRE-family HTH domain
MFFSGERLKAARKAKGYTMDDLVQKLQSEFNLEINRGMISRWENNKAKPREETVINLSQLLGVTSDFLIGTKNFENILIQQRLINKMTTEELSEKSGLSYLSLIETGVDLPDNETELEKLNKALGVDLRSILASEGINDPCTNDEVNKLKQLPTDMNKPTSIFDLDTELNGQRDIYYKERLLTKSDRLKINKMLELLFNSSDEE